MIDKRKIKLDKYLKIALASGVISAGSFIYTATRNIYDIIKNPEPQITRTYDKINKELQRMKNLKQTCTSLKPYFETPEVEQALETVYPQNKQKSEKIQAAINSLETKLSEMQSNPELVNYQTKNKQINSRFNKGMVFAAGMYFLSMLSFLASLFSKPPSENKAKNKKQ